MEKLKHQNKGQQMTFFIENCWPYLLILIFVFFCIACKMRELEARAEAKFQKTMADLERDLRVKANSRYQLKNYVVEPPDT